MAGKTVILKKDFKPISVSGKHHRILCLTGVNKGFSYYLKSKRILMGRSKRVDIPVLDQQSSRKHAELIKIDDYYVLTDLGSQNGLYVDEHKIIQHKLSDGERIIIGKTAFRYNIIINNENYEDEDEDEYEDEDEINEFKNNEGSLKGSNKDKKNKKMLFVIVGLFLLFMLLDDEGKGKKGKKKKSKKGDEISSLLKKKESRKSSDIENRVDIILKRGLREYREGNYFRAIAEFNYALILSPNHARSSFYLNRAKQDLDKEINANFERSKRSLSSLKYGEAIVANCEVTKFLKGYELDDRYKEAISNLNKIKVKLNKDMNVDLCGAKR